MKRLILIFIMLFFGNSAFAAYVFNSRGWVEYKKAGSSDWKRISSKSRLIIKEGDQLRTKRASTVQIYMDDGSKIQLAPKSAFKLRTENKKKASVGLFFGRVRSWVKKFSKKFEVRTPSAVCAVRGTDFIVSADNEGNSRVEVYSGSVLTGNASGKTVLVKKGEFASVSISGGMSKPEKNATPPASMNSAVGDAKLLAKKEIYSEISKDSVMKRAQQEIQSAEYKNRKVAIDAFGNRVRMEEYIIRPQADQFKYVVLNSREDRFDFGKILFTFNQTLPDDLSLATKTMIHASGATAPSWYLTDMNSVMSNTLDKVTEDASEGHLVADNVAAPSEWNVFFTNYDVYAAGPAEANDNGGKGKRLYGYSDVNYNNKVDTGELTFLINDTPVSISNDGTQYLDGGGNIIATIEKSNPLGDDVFNDITKNTYSDGTWIQAEDYVIFDDGKIASSGDFATRLGESKDSITDKLNFERVYTSSLFEGRKIDLEYSAKLLKDAGLLSFD